MRQTETSLEGVVVKFVLRDKKMKDVIIIGGGIAGLSAGFELYKNNIDFQILETSYRVGGNIETLKIGDYLIETGPHTISSVNKETIDLVNYLEIEDSLQIANPVAKKRFVFINGHLMPVPTNPIGFFKSDLLTKDGKWTVLEEFFVKKEEKEETVEDFISRRFGREVLKNLIQPYLSGVFAGDVKKLSANAVFPKLKELEANYKSVLLGLFLSKKFKSSMKNLTLYSFIGGMESFPKEIYEKLRNRITLSARDIEISRAKDFFIVTFKANNKTISYTTNSILFAIPAHKISEYAYLLPNTVLDSFVIEYMPVAAVNQVVDKSKLKLELEGFGFLCTKEPHRKLLGTIWTSSIFPDRAPSNKVLLTSYIGGAYYKKIVDQTEEEIKNLTSKELSEILQISDHSLIETIHVKVHHQAIPQYNIGHLEKVKQIEGLMNTNYGLFFTGNYLYGISINDTIKTSKMTVEKIKRFLNSVVKNQRELTTIN